MVDSYIVLLNRLSTALSAPNPLVRALSSLYTGSFVLASSIIPTVESRMLRDLPLAFDPNGDFLWGSVMVILLPI